MFACEEGGGSSGGAIFDPDAGTFDSGSVPEAAPPTDAPSDTTIPSSAVSVVVHRGAGLAANVTVVFHDAAGAVLEVKKTGTDGRATSSPGVTPAMATALLGGGSYKHILTWAAVEGGDELHASDLGTNGYLGELHATMQGSYADAGANGHRAYVGDCQGFPNTALTQLDIIMSSDCMRGPTASVLAMALNGGNTIGYAFKKGAPPPADGGTSTVALGAWAAPAPLAVKVANAPAPGLGQSLAQLTALSEGNAYWNDTAGAVRGGAATFDVAPGFAEAYQASVRYTPSNQGGASSVIVGKRVAAPQTEITIDMATALPIIDKADIEAANPKRPKVTWGSVAPLTATKGGSILLDWFDGRDESHGWSLIVSPTATTVTAPALPPEGKDWEPRAEGDGGVNAEYREPLITFADASILPNVAAFRREVGRIIPLSNGYDRDSRAVLPANGDIRLTTKAETPR